MGRSQGTRAIVTLSITLVASVLGIAWGAVAAGSTAADTYGVSWTRQFGTADPDIAWGVAADATGSTVVGTTHRSLAGKHRGYSDGYIRHYDDSGRIVWQRQFGTAHQDDAQGVAADARGYTVIGITDGYFPGYSGDVVLGEPDIFVRRYDRDGKHLWTRQFGTDADEEAGGVFSDGSTIVVVGATAGDIAGSKGGSDAFVRGYGLDGTELWTRQFGTPSYDSATAVAGDAAGFVVGGKTYGNLAGRVRGPVGDAFVRRFDPTGRPMWTRQFGQRGDDWVNGIAVDATGITAVGPTRARATSDALFDGFIRRFDLAGKLRWSHLIGAADAADVANDVTQDRTGLTVTGYTFDALDGRHRGGYDVFVRRYRRDGSIQWRSQFGTRAHELGSAVAASGRWFVVVGQTQGSLARSNVGAEDVFVRRYVR